MTHKQTKKLKENVNKVLTAPLQQAPPPVKKSRTIILKAPARLPYTPHPGAPGFNHF